MSAPRLNRRLVLETPAAVPDGAGGFTQGWAALGTLWAAMAAGAGRAAGGEEVIRPEVGWRITVRAAPVGAPSRPVAGQRLRAGERVFVILAVAECDADARYLTCFAREEESP